MESLFSFDWAEWSAVLVRMVVAFLLAFPIAFEREKQTQLMGLRTFPIVAMASCGFVLLGRAVATESPEAQARILQGLMTGIGFIGAGAIIKGEGRVVGTATAASVWATGALGAAIGYDRLEIALVIMLLTLVTLRLLTPLEQRIGSGSSD